MFSVTGMTALRCKLPAGRPGSLRVGRPALSPWVVAGVLLMSLATFALQVPSLLEPPWHDDAGIYAAVSHGMLRGGTLYVDVTDNRPPGLYLLYAAMLAVSGYSVPFINIVATCFSLLTQAVVCCIGHRLGGWKVGFGAAILWGLLSSLPLFDGDTANAEVFMGLPTVAGVLLLLHRRWFGAGLLFGLAFLMKQAALADLLGVSLALLLFYPGPVRVLVRFGAGYALPMLLMTAWLLWQGTAEQFLYAGFGYYLGYVQRANNGAKVPLEFELAKALLLALACAAIALYNRDPRDQRRFENGLVLMWLSFALFGTFITSRPFHHYLQQALLPGTLTLVLLLARSGRPRLHWRPLAKAAAPVALVAGAALVFGFIYLPWPGWNAPVRSLQYYQNFALYMTGQRDARAYNDFFDRRVNRNLALTAYLRSHSSPGDYLVVWGEEPWLYPLSGMHVGCPYTVAYFAWEMPGGLQRVVQDLKTDRPRFVVWTKTRPLFNEMKAEIDRHYREALVIDNVVVLERKAESAG